MTKGVLLRKKCTNCTKIGTSGVVSTLVEFSIVTGNDYLWADKIPVKGGPFPEITKKIDVVKVGTAVECTGSNVLQIVGNTGCFQSGATGKCTFSNKHHGYGDLYAAKAGAAGKGLFADGIQGVRQVDFCQFPAIPETTFTDCSNDGSVNLIRNSQLTAAGVFGFVKIQDSVCYGKPGALLG